MKATAVLFLVAVMVVSVYALRIEETNEPTVAAPAAPADPHAPAKEGEKKDAHGKKHNAHPSFSYDCKNKADPSCPRNWKSLKIENNQCGSKKRQSPIDLPRHIKISNYSSWTITTDYETLGEQTEVINNGHTLEIDFPDKSKSHLTVNYGGKDGNAEYQLKQFHFHTPSEHTVAGERAPLEMHMVHKRLSGPKESEPFLVLGFFFAEGFKNSFLSSFFNRLPSPPTGHGAPNKKKLLAKTVLKLNRMVQHVSKEFLYIYKGSLTTPPCSEVVQWVIVASPLTCSADQIDDVVANLPEARNNRPIQKNTDQIIYATPGPQGSAQKAAPAPATLAPKF